MGMTDLRQSLSFGLAQMQERVASRGGRLELTSTPGQGTLLRVWLPN